MKKKKSLVKLESISCGYVSISRYLKSRVSAEINFSQLSIHVTVSKGEKKKKKNKLGY